MWGNNNHGGIKDRVVQHALERKGSTKFGHLHPESNKELHYYLHKSQYGDHIVPWKDIRSHQVLIPRDRH